MRRPIARLARLLPAAAAFAAAPAFAQLAGGDAAAEAPGVGPLPTADRLSIGGPPLSDASPRLPRVGYGSGDLAPGPLPAGALRGSTVLDRSRPAYDPVGLRTAGLLIQPQLSMRAGYTSNVFNQPGARDDVFGRVRAAVAARSLWSRHSLSAEGFVDQRNYAQYRTEDGLTYNVALAGRADITRRSAVSLGAQVGHVLVERGATTEVLATRRPIRYDLRGANAGVSIGAGRFSFGLSGTLSQFDYQNAQTPDGAPLDQQFRDFTLYDAKLEVAYGAPAGAAVFVSARRELRRFRLTTEPRRDANSIELLTGLRGDITPLIRGQLGVGYLRADFKDPQRQSRGGLGLDTSLSYLATELTTFSLRARRLLKNVASVAAPASLSLELSAGADHELLPNLILSPNLRYEKANYIGSPLVVQRYGADFGAVYMIDRQFRLDGNVGYRKRTENRTVNSRAFDEVNVLGGITYSF